ncbi:MAG TPA: VanZ family protein [Ruminiclostridium sp.]
MGIIPIWLLLRTIILLVKKKNNKQIDLKRELIINIFAVYVFSYIGITLFPITIFWVKQQYFMKPTIQLIPFKPIFDAVLSHVPIRLIVINTFGNIILTIPFGVFLTLLWNQKFKKISTVTVFGLVVSLLTEILQYIQGILLPSIQTRQSDVNDIILNVIGVLIGYLIFKALYILNYKDKVESKVL